VKSFNRHSFNSLLSKYQKGKINLDLDLLKQETVSGWWVTGHQDRNGTVDKPKISPITGL